MTSLERGDSVRVTRWHEGRYIVLEDALCRIDTVSLRLVTKNFSIPFSDIVALEKL